MSKMINEQQQKNPLTHVQCHEEIMSGTALPCGLFLSRQAVALVSKGAPQGVHLKQARG